MKKNTLYVALPILFSLMAYQNCSMVGSSHDEGVAYSKGCGSTVEKMYRTSYYPHFRDQCAACHSDGGKGRVYFASSDFDIAYRNFLGTGRQKIEAMMLTTGHQGNPYNGPGQQSFIDRYKSQWETAEAAAQACTISNAVVTTSKNTQTGNLVNADNGDPNTTKWKVLEWDLYNEVSDPALMGKIPLIVNIQYRQLILSGQTLGFEFRRPTGRLRMGAPAGTALTLDGMTIYVNGKLLGNATAYETMVATVNSATATPLIVGGNAPAPVQKDPVTGLPMMDFVNDRIALHFNEIRDQNGDSATNPGGGGGGGGAVPARVTFADLTSVSSTLGVFPGNCISCHNGGNMAGGLNLTDYASSFGKAAQIKARVRSAAAPMPPSGLMPQFEQDVVSKWVDIGAPQN